jgi:hypothetical protein
MNPGNSESNAQEEFIAYLKAVLDEVAAREYLRGRMDERAANQPIKKH